MALRKMNLLSVNKLAQKDRKKARKVLIEVQNVLFACGLNWAGDGASYIMNFAYNIKYRWKGKISEDPRELLKVYGVGRKVLMLMFQDVWPIHPNKGIVCDRHVTTVFFNLGLTTVPMPNNPENAADRVAEEAEKWIPRAMYRDVNEHLASPRQLWSNKYNYLWMKNGAKELQCYELLRVIASE
jgi:endonuclease III